MTTSPISDPPEAGGGQAGAARARGGERGDADERRRERDRARAGAPARAPTTEGRLAEAGTGWAPRQRRSPARCPAGPPRVRRARRTGRSRRATSRRRGRTAVATAASPAAAKGEKVGSGPSVSRHASTRPPAAAPAAIRSGTRGWRGAGSSKGDTPGSGPPSRPSSSTRAPPPGRSHRAAHAEQASPRRGGEAHPAQGLRLDQAALRPCSSFSAAFSSARSRAGGGLSAGSGSSASSIASHSGSGRSRRARASEGSGRPRRRAVAAGPAAPDRVRARPRLVQGQRERVDVARGRHAGALRLLRRHVGQRPDDVAGASQRVGRGNVRHPEVGELREPRPRGGVGEHHDVPRLHVAMDDPARVRVLERVAQGAPDARYVAVRDRSGPGQLRKRSAPNQLGDQVHVVVVGRQLVDADDAGVVQPCGGTRLARDPLTLAALARDHLHGDLALELLVPRQPHDAEPARAQAALHPVAADDEVRPRTIGKPLCRVRSAQGQGARLIREACFRTCHASFVFGFRRARPAPRSYSHRRAHQARTALGAIRLSFLDEPDEPARRPTRRTPRGPATDRQTLLVRRTIAAGAAILVFILLVIAFKGCLNARTERNMQDYVRNTNELVDLSKAESRRLFAILEAPSDQTPGHRSPEPGEHAQDRLRHARGQGAQPGRPGPALEGAGLLRRSPGAAP